MTAKQTVDAKEKLGRADALRLARSASIVTVAKQKNVVTFRMKKDPPDDKELLSHMLGPTGNLRAPTVRKGGIILVGFNEAAYQQLL